MAGTGIGARAITAAQAAVNMPPVIGRDVSRIKPQLFDCIDTSEHPVHFGPSGNMKQQVAAGPNMSEHGVALAAANSANDADCAVDRAIIVRAPANEGKNTARCKGDNPAAAIDNLVGGDPAKAYPVFLDTLDPQAIDFR